MYPLTLAIKDNDDKLANFTKFRLKHKFHVTASILKKFFSRKYKQHQEKRYYAFKVFVLAAFSNAKLSNAIVVMKTAQL